MDRFLNFAVRSLKHPLILSGRGGDVGLTAKSSAYPCGLGAKVINRIRSQSIVIRSLAVRLHLCIGPYSTPTLVMWLFALERGQVDFVHRAHLWSSACLVCKYTRITIITRKPGVLFGHFWISTDMSKTFAQSLLTRNTKWLDTVLFIIDKGEFTRLMVIWLQAPTRHKSGSQHRHLCALQWCERRKKAIPSVRFWRLICVWYIYKVTVVVYLAITHPRTMSCKTMNFYSHDLSRWFLWLLLFADSITLFARDITLILVFKTPDPSSFLSDKESASLSHLIQVVWSESL